MSVDKSCLARLQREYRALLKDPVPGIEAHPQPNNLLEWHYVLQGAEDSHYAGGLYHGKISFPRQYPYKPPSIVMFTPNGRFATNQKLCLSMTDFHPESWNPMWSVGSILTGLMSFMLDDAAPTTGSISTSKEHKREQARKSLAFNVKNPAFRRLFPRWVEEQKRREKEGVEGEWWRDTAGKGQGREGRTQGQGPAQKEEQKVATGPEGNRRKGEPLEGRVFENQYMYYMPALAAIVIALGLMVVPFMGT
eukprot:evm.model.scf_2143.1 EVM.evm.TU.scf_2143.1   scf_2143:23542-24291(-)